MISIHRTPSTLLALGLFALTACSAADEPSSQETSNPQLLAAVELEDGMQITFRADDNGDIAIDAAAEKANLSQLESLDRLVEAEQAGLSPSALYELFAGERAPDPLLTAEARLDAARTSADADEVEEEAADALEGEDALAPSPDADADDDTELRPLMSFGDFEDTHCYKDTWAGYHSTSDRCRGNLTAGVSHTSSSRDKEGTFAIVDVISRDQLRVWHRREVGGSWVSSLDSNCLGYHKCASTVLGSGARRQVMTLVQSPGNTTYHIYSAILEDD